MIRTAVGFVVLLALLASARTAAAQTAEEVIDRSLAALGGRAAHAKITSRSTTGSITIGTPAGEIVGSIELTNATPNKSRSVIRADLTALGVGQLVIDQRFNGETGYALDSLQGNRDITGNQLENLRNGSFPHPFMSYKELGVTVSLAGKETVEGREAHVILFQPKSGSSSRQYIDAETFLPIKLVMTVNLPQIGGDMEQTTAFSDYREVDGIKVPFAIASSSSVQNFTVSIAKIEHNVKVDEALFAKPAP
jgi:outer membrane lipoprotein-sorting protein